MTAWTRALTVEDALNDIEIELLQGAVTRDDLGQSVQNVRRFQNQVRGETLDAHTRPDYRAIANRQFQINDMLLTLAQEMATRQAALELDLHKAVRSGLRREATPAAGQTPVAAADQAGADQAGADQAGADQAAMPERSRNEELVRRLDALQSAMRDDALALQIEVTPTTTPLIGRMLGGVRTALHSLVVFYSSRLAARQAEINHTFGDNLRRLLQDRARDQETIEQLAAEIAQLRARLDADEAPRP